MSDQPLFQNTDEQEAIYAPQELPADSAAHHKVRADDRERDTDTTTDAVGVPAAGAGLLSQTGGGLGASVGSTNPAGTAVGTAAPDDETTGTDHDHEPDTR